MEFLCVLLQVTLKMGLVCHHHYFVYPYFYNFIASPNGGTSRIYSLSISISLTLNPTTNHKPTRSGPYRTATPLTDYTEEKMITAHSAVCTPVNRLNVNLLPSSFSCNPHANRKMLNGSVRTRGMPSLSLHLISLHPLAL